MTYKDLYELWNLLQDIINTPMPIKTAKNYMILINQVKFDIEKRIQYSNGENFMNELYVPDTLFKKEEFEVITPNIIYNMKDFFVEE